MGNQIKKEISIMKVVHHPNVVQLKEVLASRTKIFIVLELVTGGELFDSIVKEGKFSDDKARKYFRQLIHGLSYCNTKGVCHRDLKPENLLLDQNANLKISDFGLSALYTGGDDGETNQRTLLLHTTCGTPNYVAPEVLEDKGYDGKKADIWSCGVILYVLLAGFLPFDEKKMADLFRKIQAAEVQYPAWFSDDVRDLLRKILTADPGNRANISEIQQHQWYTKGGTLTNEDHLEGSEGREEGGGELGAGGGGGEGGGGAGDVGGGADAGVPGGKGDNGGAAAFVNDDDAQNSMVRTQSEAKVKRVFQFIAKGPSATLLQTLSGHLEGMGCELKVYDEAMKIKACRLTGSGMIGVVLQVNVMGEDIEDGTCMVEVRRGKGDLLEYSKFYKELTEEKLKGVIEEVIEQEVPPVG